MHIIVELWPGMDLIESEANYSLLITTNTKQNFLFFSKITEKQKLLCFSQKMAILGHFFKKTVSTNFDFHFFMLS